ncbi:MAG: pyruvate phosphate dikinase, partial [Candidatus Solibacter sp.]|nr:pyruvate phosphate dikinase [Candidatus Solibacter sp.]
MTKYVYSFGNGTADGDGKMKDTLGGKGAGLAEMCRAKLPVPPGFTISTQVCNIYFDNKFTVPKDIHQEMLGALATLEERMGQKLGDTENPLLVSVRSGAKFSMPGMMDTILNLGLNDKTVKALEAKSNNARFAYDCYRRFIQMYGAVVLEVPKHDFDEVFEGQKKKVKAKLDTELTAKDLQDVIEAYKKLVQKKTGKPFPQDALEQLAGARDAVFRSWFNDRAKYYRKMNQIPDDLGTAVNVQGMVFGNLGETSATGVGFTRNPATGENVFYGEFLENAQGEDVVAGIRTPHPISELAKWNKAVYDQLREITTMLENHYRDIQDFEYTIQDGKLYMLQTRNGKRTGPAAVRIAVEMVEQGLIDKKEAILRVDPQQLDQLLHPVLDPKQIKTLTVLAKGLPASPGAAVGTIVFSAEDAVEKSTKAPVILVRKETVPDDIAGMEVAKGILTARGGMTSHAAVVCRGMGTPCVAGAETVTVNEHKKEVSVSVNGKTILLHEGDWLSLDGSTGVVYAGKASTLEADPKSGVLAKFMGWADEFRGKFGVRANADIPRDAKVARKFGAEGIGLCRTEHMFFAEDRIEH